MFTSGAEMFQAPNIHGGRRGRSHRSGLPTASQRSGGTDASVRGTTAKQARLLGCSAWNDLGRVINAVVESDAACDSMVSMWRRAKTV